MNRHTMSDMEKMRLANVIWSITYKYAKTDVEAEKLFFDFFEMKAEQGDKFAVWVLSNMGDQLRSLWLGRWRDQGFPKISIDSSYASLLIATDITDDIMKFIIPPWLSFLIEIKGEPILTFLDPELNKRVNVQSILVQSIYNHVQTWNIIVESDSGVQLWKYGLSSEFLIKPMNEVRSIVGTKEMCHDNDLGAFPLDNEDERLLLVIGKLILNVCLAMSDPNSYRKQKPTKGRGTHCSIDGPFKQIQNFILGKPVNINLKDTISDYISGVKRNTPKVRFLVRGHWRNVVIGHGRQERRLQHIEPYWKGKQFDNAVIRPHTIKETEDP